MSRKQSSAKICGFVTQMMSIPMLLISTLCLLSCGNNEMSGGNDKYVSGREVSGSQEQTEDEIVREPEYVEPEKPKQIEWSDGNTYSYEYTESIDTKDSTGNPITLTVYKQHKPDENEVNCELKTCKWCGRQVQAESYSIVEYPNINGFRDHTDAGSVFDVILNAAFGFLNTDYLNHFDLENRRIRTEWRLECNYPGPQGFCSLKCKSEYQYR